LGDGRENALAQFNFAGEQAHPLASIEAHPAVKRW
jgi:hypothetical protein